MAVRPTIFGSRRSRRTDDDGFTRFPIQEYGMNWDSLPLQEHEVQIMMHDPIILQRLLRSYALMLDFYGMRLLSEDTGLLERSTNYEDRYRNLKRKYSMSSPIPQLGDHLTIERFLHPRVITQQSPNHSHSQMSLGVWFRTPERWVPASCVE